MLKVWYDLDHENNKDPYSGIQYEIEVPDNYVVDAIAKYFNLNKKTAEDICSMFVFTVLPEEYDLDDFEDNFDIDKYHGKELIDCIYDYCFENYGREETEKTFQADLDDMRDDVEYILEEHPEFVVEDVCKELFDDHAIYGWGVNYENECTPYVIQWVEEIRGQE